MVADFHAGTLRTRRSRRPDTANVSAVTRASMTGSSIHSQDGDRIEKPANTGCSTQGDFSAPMVTAPGTSGDSPADITRISSGVIAAIASGHTASAASDSRPAQPYSRPRGGPPEPGKPEPGGPRTTMPISRTNVTPANPAGSATAA